MTKPLTLIEIKARLNFEIDYCNDKIKQYEKRKEELKKELIEANL